MLGLHIDTLAHLLWRRHSALTLEGAQSLTAFLNHDVCLLKRSDLLQQSEMYCLFWAWEIRGVLFICTLGLQRRSQDFPLGGGLSDFSREMFTTGRQTWSVSVILK